MNDPAPSLAPGDLAWRCDVYQIEHGRVTAPATERAWINDLKPIASRLYLEAEERSPGRLFLVHRGGWPFDLRTLDADAVGRTVEELRPRGGGDEVLRDLLDSFHGACPGFTLHVHSPLA